MHSIGNSIRKRLYSFRLSSSSCAKTWQQQYWQGKDNDRIISCKTCPKFSAKASICTIPFGSPLRQCVTAAQEANLHSLNNKSLLEIGFGKHSIPKRLVTSAGGTWTGIEPMLPATQSVKLGKGGYGHVANIPFPDGTFDFVTGIQSLEHWEEPLPNIPTKTSYQEALKEIHRVLKSNGSIYFDAPIHLHGHEMFISGDFKRIRDLFDPSLWQDIVIERWREDYAPLERYPTPEGDVKSWKSAVSSYSKKLLEDIRLHKSVSLVTVKARKK